MSDTVLVTGATGFVGSAVARCLLRSGYHVRALIRENSVRDNIEGLDLETVIGDLRDPPSLQRALDGCDGLFHVAADYRLWARRPQQLYATNVDGTRNIVLAAERAGVGRIVYTSSVATMGLRADGGSADEDTPVTLGDMIGDYKRSKYLAEEMLHQLSVEHDLDVVTVNPATPVGPRDIKPTPTGRVIRDAVCRRLPAYVDTGLDIVHVDDVAHGHLAAYERGLRGRRYILGGENLTLREILERVAAIAGHPPPKVRLAHGVVMPVAWLAERWARISTREPLVTVTGVKLARKRMFFTHARATRELGYNPRPAQEALIDAVNWFLAHGHR